jgi:hypothetical protein
VNVEADGAKQARQHREIVVCRLVCLLGHERCHRRVVVASQFKNLNTLFSSVIVKNALVNSNY